MGCSYMQSYCQCPYYVGDDGKSRITCEGILPGSNISSYFRSRKDYRLQLEIFCCRAYKNCEIYLALEDKHEDEE